MSWFDKFKEGLSQKVAQYNNGPFLDATMALCAAVCYADGEFSADEKAKVLKFIDNCEYLACFDIAKRKEAFDFWFTKFAGDADFAKMDAMNCIGKMKGTGDQAEMLIKLGCVIGSADGDFDDQEKAVVAEACNKLQLTPSDFGV